MKLDYKRPYLHTVPIQLGVFGSYGESDDHHGGDDDDDHCGGDGHHGGGRGWRWGGWRWGGWWGWL